MDYREFLEQKVCVAPRLGFDIEDHEVNPLLKPHQRAIVRWMVAGGRRACFAAFGLGKTMMQLEAVRLTLTRCGGRGLIVVPLGVKQEFTHDAAMLGIDVRFVRRIEECGETGIYLTNYETVRDGKLDPKHFRVASLDEASALRGFGGTKTFRVFMAMFAGDDRAAGVRHEGVPYRYLATATPSPNEYIELLAYAAYLDVMDVGQAKTRFFKRDSTKADSLTIHPHKEAEFWLWVASWALFVTKPSDVDQSFSNDGYMLPKLDVRWHELPSDHRNAGHEKDGQARMFRAEAIGVQNAAKEKRDSLTGRISKLVEIVSEAPEDHFILWHDLEDERRAIKAALPEAVEVYGSQDLDERERRIVAFSEGQSKILAGKPSMLGSGCNFQRHCHRAVFLGIGFKFNDLIQAIHRIHRFLQTAPVRIDLIYTEAEREVRRTLERKWQQHEELVANMTAIIQQYGLADAALAHNLLRSIGVQRAEVTGNRYKLINNDSVEECRNMPENSVGLIVTSIPFSHQYEYTPSYNDFGHTDDNDHFWRQMDFLTPHLLRVLQPGRIAAIHVKDRICPGGVNGFGFQTVQPFSDECVAHFIKHGWAFLARKTVVTDVVRENNQTYRLGWSEQCKDGSRMGAGMPEYVLLFRKPPTDRSNGYADVPVVKSKIEYTRARWQMDAHGFTRSSGNRHLRPEELEGLDQQQIFRMFREYSMGTVYDFEHNVKIAEAVDETGWLPSTFMLLQPQSWHPDVWTDITRMLTLNSSQHAKGREMHLCPLQFDIVDRMIVQCSNPGDVVFDPFAGLGTVPVRAIKHGRYGLGCELNGRYFLDSCAYAKAEEDNFNMPDLFGVVAADTADAPCEVAA